MSLRNAIFFAWQSVTRHRLRSFLALAGIAVGALATVSVVSVEQSWQRTVDKAFRGLNLNLVEVGIAGNVQGAHLRRKALTDEDAAAIRQRCSAVEKLTVRTWDAGDVHAGRARPQGPVTVQAIDPEFSDIFGLRAVEGRLLTREELERGIHVCTVTRTLGNKLFGSPSAIGQSLRLQGVAFRVVGVAAESDEDSPFEYIYIPRTLYREVFHKRPEASIEALARDPDLAVRQIEALMRQRVGDDDRVWFAQSPWLARQTALGVRRHVQIIGFLAALCTLLLGGYGVGSVLYIAVTESAREIGVRRALGASRAMVALEVVLAGLIFGVVGAGLGVALGKFGAMLAAVAGTALPPGFQETLYDRGGMSAGLMPAIPSQFSAAISWQAALTGAAFSVLVCVIASLEPALEVANLNPAQAISIGMAPAHRLRLALVVAQAGIAVAAIALLPALYESLDERDRREFRRVFGTDRITVAAYEVDKPIHLSGGAKPSGWRPGVAASFKKALLRPTLSADLLSACPLLRAVEASIVFLPSSIKVGGRVVWPDTGANITGWCMVRFVTPTYYPTETRPTAAFAGRGEIKYGQFFTAAMVRAKERVCVLDSEATRIAFGETDGVGATVRINGVPLRVLGTMAGGVVSGRFGGREETNSGNIFVPISLYPELLPALLSGQSFHVGTPLDSELTAHAVDEAAVPGAAQQLRAALVEVMPGGLGGKLFLSEPTYGSLREYFALRGPAAKRSAFSAGMLLLIALIGLANMLLVSLTERTRELGIRRALGARKTQVMLPLLVEGAWLAALGSVLGVGLAWLLAWVLRAAVVGQGFLALSNFWALAAGLAMVLTSLLVSLIPGALATRVNPATALRSE